MGCDSQPVSVSDERSSTPNQDSQNLQVPSFHIPSETTLDEPSARRLFDGKTLTGWESTNFGGEGEVVVSDGTIQLAMGYPMTGITATSEELPTDHYEISLDAMRVDGTDFFLRTNLSCGSLVLFVNRRRLGRDVSRPVQYRW